MQTGCHLPGAAWRHSVTCYKTSSQASRNPYCRDHCLPTQQQSSANPKTNNNAALGVTFLSEVCIIQSKHKVQQSLFMHNTCSVFILCYLNVLISGRVSVAFGECVFKPPCDRKLRTNSECLIGVHQILMMMDHHPIQPMLWGITFWQQLNKEYRDTYL